MDGKQETLPEDYHQVWRVLKCHHPRFFENFSIAALFLAADVLSCLSRFVDIYSELYGELLFEQYRGKVYSSRPAHANICDRHKK